jgi:hypothetical protein
MPTRRSHTHLGARRSPAPATAPRSRASSTRCWPRAAPSTAGGRWTLCAAGSLPPLRHRCPHHHPPPRSRGGLPVPAPPPPQLHRCLRARDNHPASAMSARPTPRLVLRAPGWGCRTHCCSSRSGHGHRWAGCQRFSPSCDQLCSRPARAAPLPWPWHLPAAAAMVVPAMAAATELRAAAAAPRLMLQAPLR